MATALDLDRSPFIDRRFYIVVARCDRRERRIDIDLRDCARRLLNPHNLSANRIAHLAEQIIFQRNQLVLGAENDIFQLFQPVGRIALCVCQGLFTDEIIRHQILKGIRHLKIVAKYLIELDFQVFDACLFALALTVPASLFLLSLHDADGLPPHGSLP